jgi:hypothetical protein
MPVAQVVETVVAEAALEETEEVEMAPVAGAGEEMVEVQA